MNRTARVAATGFGTPGMFHRAKRTRCACKMSLAFHYRFTSRSDEAISRKKRTAIDNYSEGILRSHLAFDEVL